MNSLILAKLVFLKGSNSGKAQILEKLELLKSECLGILKS